MGFLSDQMLNRVLVRFTVILSLMLVYGCAYLPVSQDHSDQGDASAMPEDLSRFLNDHREAATREFAASPWGGGVLIKAEPVYFSAIGEYCRRIFVSGAQGEQALLACQESGGQWYTRRLVVPLY
ncbi:MAG: DVU3141 family protein [Gammaproteobacteria bacterium]